MAVEFRLLGNIEGSSQLTGNCSRLATLRHLDVLLLVTAEGGAHGRLTKTRWWSHSTRHTCSVPATQSYYIGCNAQSRSITRSRLTAKSHIEALIDGHLVELGPARQRCILAALLVEANQPVVPDQLVDRVWADRAPHRARETLRTYLARLRGALTVTEEVEIGRRCGGYVLIINPLAVDLHHFRYLAAQARAAVDSTAALGLFEQAVGLWRGEAFAGLDTPWINTVRDTAEAERVAVQLDYTDLRLTHGLHHELLAELFTRFAARPLDERLAGQLMLALYRCGRQADALTYYHQTRSRLIEELGADPGPALRRLHQQILTADPALTAPTSEARITRPGIPKQLPAAPRLFTGRGEELAQLSKAIDERGDAGDTVVISAIGGVGGIGKTWLALHWAHQNIDRFPDGQLQVNLRGFDPCGEPMPPSVAVRGFLDALGVEPAAIPVDHDAQVALYRSQLAGRRMLILLDNARGTEQVEPLLPGSPTCTVLVTSRHQLAGLVVRHGARPLALDVLTQAQARELFSRNVGAARVAAEPEAVAELLNWCAGLPIAISIVAAHAARHTSFPLTVLAAALREESRRLDTLDGGELGVNLRSVFSWSYRTLDHEQAQVFGLLGLAPGPDIGLAAAANLTALPISRARAALDGLVDASLLQHYTPGRYRMHDLLRLYAAEQAHYDLTPQATNAALRRLVDFYLHTAYTCDRLLAPQRLPIELDPPVPGCHPAPLADQAAALTWFEAEHPCLLASQHLASDRGWHSAVWQLAWTLTIFHVRQGRLHDRLAAWQAGLAAAEHEGDPAILLRAHRGLGRAYARAGRHAEAREHLYHALRLVQATGDLLGQAQTHGALTGACAHQGDDQRALEHATSALRLFQSLGQPTGEAVMLNAVGWLHARLGHFQPAYVHCEAALTLFRHHRNRQGEASTMDSLGYLARRTGHHDQAFDYHRRALTLYRSLGHTYEEANTLDNLGQAHLALGQHDQARHAWRQAFTLYQAQHRGADADRVQRELAAIEEDGRRK